MSKLGVRPNYYFGPIRVGNKRKKSDFNEVSFWDHEPLINGKKQKNMSGFGIFQF